MYPEYEGTITYRVGEVAQLCTELWLAHSKGVDCLAARAALQNSQETITRQYLGAYYGVDAPRSSIGKVSARVV